MNIKHWVAIATLLFVGLALVQAQDTFSRDSNSRHHYVIKFAEPGLLNYIGNISNLRATAPSSLGNKKFDPRSAESKSYIQYLDGIADIRIAEMNSALGRQIAVRHRYKASHSGLMVNITENEAIVLRNMAKFISVAREPIYFLDTERGPEFIGANQIWDGTAVPDATPNKGEGMVLGIIDTGINTNHPSYADISGDAYDHDNPLGAGIYLGDCIGGTSGNDLVTCNDKLIGAWDFSGDGTPEDDNGHGSHTASTAGGNVVLGPFNNVLTGGSFAATQASGVAHRANIIAYKVCGAGGCTGITAGIDQAILDGVDAINYSIGPGSGQGLSPWLEEDDVRFLDAVNAGIFVAASAGNTRMENPNPEADVAHKGPWIMTVAMSTHDRLNKNRVDITSPAPPANVQDLYGLLGSGPAFPGDVTDDPIVWAGAVDPTNFEGCNVWTGMPFMNSIALISRGACNFSDKVDNAAAAGATSVVVFNAAGILPIVMGALETTTIPSLMVGQADGENMRDFIMANPTATSSLDADTIIDYQVSAGNILNPGSLNGPNLDFNLTKPSINAPGTNIFAAYADQGGDPNDNPMEFLTGTSMSSPHTAGSGILVMQSNPDWTVMEVKSAMMMTATTTNLKPDGVTPADSDDVGAGTIDLSKAAKAGLVMDASYQSMLNADPAVGGDPITVNVPSVRDMGCNPDCSWTRTVRNTLSTNGVYSASGSGNGFTVAVSPINFELLPGDILFQDDMENVTGPSSSFQTLLIDATGVASANLMTFGEVIIVEDGGLAPDSRISVSVSQSLPDVPAVR